MKKKVLLVAVCVAAGAFMAFSQAPAAPQGGAMGGMNMGGGRGMGGPAGPASVATELKNAYNRNKGYIQKAADRVPEDLYTFTVNPAERNFGLQIAHIADAQVGTCSRVNGQMRQGTASQKKTRAEFVAALTDSFAECDKAYEGTTDANAMEVVPGGRGSQTRLGVLWGNIAHNNEMYGTIAVYMRAKNLVPPSSDPAPAMGKGR